VSVENNAGFPVRVVISAGGGQQILSPSPGGSSYAEIEEGEFSVYAVPELEWVEYARSTRRYLNEQLAHPENLTGEQLLEVINRLVDIAAQMDRMGRAVFALRPTSGCSGAVESGSSALVSVTTGADGSLVVTCQ
jgi:hypothetical protein